MAFIYYLGLTEIFIISLIIHYSNGQCGIASCNTCESPGVKCNVCKDGYILNNQQSACLACPAFCVNCVDANADGVTECLKCEEGFFIDGARCSWCPGHCSHCSNTFQCSVCSDNFKLQEEEACERCATGCNVCSDSSYNSCFNCSAGYYLVSNDDSSNTGYCTRCVQGCEVCTSSTSCKECNLGMTWNKDRYICTDCVSNCDPLYCSTEAGCTQCYEGWFYAPESAACRDCSFCEEGYCLNTVGCTKCLSGYVLNEDRTCHACLNLDGDSEICRSCGRNTRGRFLVNNQCQYCEANCLECTSSDACIACVPGYFIDSTGSCSACHAECDTCRGSTNTDCESCRTGEGLNAVEGTCIDCNVGVDHCDECTGTVCESCTEGFYLYPFALSNNAAPSNGECRECPSDRNEFSIMNEICITCDTNVPQGKYLTPLPCQECGSNCLSCTSTGVCVQCDTNFFITTTGTCEVIGSIFVPDSCLIKHQNSANAVKCSRCLDDYYYDGEHCLPDNVGGTPAINGSSCLIYSTSDTTPADGVQCVQCEGHMRWDFETGDLGDCIPDDPADHCEVWNVPTSAAIPVTCALCDPGYFLVDASNAYSIDGQVLTPGDCVQHTTTITNCHRYGSAAKCDECDAGFFTDLYQNLCIGCSFSTRDQTSFICEQCQGSGVSDHATYQSWRGKCLSCPEDCIKCTAPSSCDICKEDKYWDAVTQRCTDLACKDVSKIDTEEHCYKCQPHNRNRNFERRGLAWIEESVCVECAINCEFCNVNTATCAQCRDGYSWSEISQICVECHYESQSTCDQCIYENRRGHYFNPNTITCNSCDDGCVSCTETSCLLCSSLFYRDVATDSCLPCSNAQHTQESCTKCNTGGYFTPPRYWIADESGALDCRACPGDCMVCDSVQSCAKCDDGRYFNDALGSCQACTVGCLECISAEACDKCADGRYYSAAQSACIECMLACEACAEEGTCTRCAKDYTYHAATSSCQACPANCDVCTHAGGCTECAEMFYSTVNGQCDLCKDAVSNCQTCNSTLSTVKEGVTAIVCTACEPGFYIVISTEVTCAACDEGCLECSAADICTTCGTGYCLDTSVNICRYTGLLCTECQLSSVGAVICTACNSGYFLELCQACEDEYCLSCGNDISVCSSCREGSYFDTERRTCVGCVPGCSSCTDSVSCNACSSGTYWDSASVFCARCPDNCAKCSQSVSGVTCQVCPANNQYIDIVTQRCHDCLANCQICSSSDTCGRCMEGYRLVFKTTPGAARPSCAKCPSSCKACTLQSEDLVSCDACENGYLLQEEGTCRGCSLANCDECIHTPELCTDCENPMIPTEDQTQCGAPCYACTGNSCEEFDNSAVNNTNSNYTNTNITIVGCVNGCWGFLLETDNGTVMSRGCNDNQTLDCDTYADPQCEDITHDDTGYQADRLCSQCCSGDGYCNTFDITNPQSRATLERSITFLTLISLTYSITMNNCLW